MPFERSSSTTVDDQFLGLQIQRGIKFRNLRNFLRDKIFLPVTSLSSSHAISISNHKAFVDGGINDGKNGIIDIITDYFWNQKAHDYLNCCVQSCLFTFFCAF